MSLHDSLERGFDIVFLIGIFIASFAGSVHCVGMCGGLVLASTQPDMADSLDNKAKRQSSLIFNQILYHGARLLSYLIIGGVAGFIGKSLLTHKISFYLSVFAAVSVAGMFIYTGARILRGVAARSFIEEYLARVSLTLFPKLYRMKGFFRPLMTGLATGLLPCGWLYSFVLLSLATKSPWQGALVLAAFWLGTVPALSFAPLLLQRFFAQMNLKVYRLVGVMLILFGFWTLYGRAWHIIDVHGVIDVYGEGGASGVGIKSLSHEAEADSCH